SDSGWRRLLDHLAATGPSSIDDLRTELRLKRQELKALRPPLERCGAIVSRSLPVTAGAGEQHASVLARWDQVRPARGDTGTGPADALKDLAVAGVRAAVVAPEAELRRWFSWQWYWTSTLVDDLVRAGRLRRVDGYLAAAAEGQSRSGCPPASPRRPSATRPPPRAQPARGPAIAAPPRAAAGPAPPRRPAERPSGARRAGPPGGPRRGRDSAPS